MRWALALAAASCGRLGFDAPRIADAIRDVATDAPIAPSMTALSSATTGDNGNMVTTFTVPITKVVAGDLVIVGITDHHGVAVATIVDGNGTALTSTHAQAVNGAESAELWYEADAGASDSLTITMQQGSFFDVFVGEFAGTTATPAATAMKCLQYPPDIVSAPVTTTVPNTLVFTATMLAYPLYVSQMDPPFTGFAPLTGNDAGFLVATTPGSYGSTFELASGAGMTAMTCATTAMWLPR